VRKIPTVFRRDPEDLKHVLPEVHPACGWVLAGEGIATRKYDGTCVQLDEDGTWWARREVKPGKPAPAGYRPVETDVVTGKTVGWEPIEQSAFGKFWQQALADDPRTGEGLLPGTYELIGPKINGNPEGSARHALIRHADAERIDVPDLSFDGLRRAVLALAAERGVEGIVWHAEDGRAAKLKGRDFPG
jgi:hypothetical protein